MKKHQLQTLSPIDGRYADKCTAIRDLFSEESLIRYRVITEIRWLQFLAQEKEISHISSIPETTNYAMENIIDDFSLDDAVEVKKIESKINHDVKAVEYFLQNKLLKIPGGSDYVSSIHFACTSEDINNISYAMMIRDTVAIIQSSLEEIGLKLRTNSHQWSNAAMLSHTHGQAATPTTMGKEFANFLDRLNQQMVCLDEMKFKAKINGAVGNFNAHRIAYPNADWPQISKTFIQNMGLEQSAYTTQIEPHDWIAELLHCFIRINNILLDFSRDIWLYISFGYFKQVLNKNEVGSSTMPHKINPIDFENAEGNLGLANALFSHLSSKLSISRLQRDLSDSTALRNIGSGFGYAVIAYASLKKGLEKIQLNEEIILKELESHWEVIAEAIQTVLRREQIDDAYEKLKDLTQGQDLEKQDFVAFIQSIDLEDSVKQELLNLTPENYLGFAAILAKKI
ncbi:MAG: adenylosuccinate lyase [Gammaproteobacteria bacterium]|nr:adenylosuccinate lyase [Gammaproteobacteria bacterium]